MFHIYTKSFKNLITVAESDPFAFKLLDCQLLLHLLAGLPATVHIFVLLLLYCWFIFVFLRWLSSLLEWLLCSRFSFRVHLSVQFLSFPLSETVLFLLFDNSTLVNWNIFLFFLYFRRLHFSSLIIFFSRLFFSFVRIFLGSGLLGDFFFLQTSQGWYS